MKTAKIISIVCWLVTALILIGLVIWFLSGNLFGFRTGFKFNIPAFHIGSFERLTGPFNAVGSFEAPAGDVNSLDINWVAGSATVTPYDGDTKKVAILMTDGEYNVQYDTDGIQSDMPGAGSPANTISRTQARTLCTNMKDSGIEIYTVGFALGNDQTAIETMNLCASSPAQAYIANNGDQLRESFRDIALRISNLYLTN